MATPSKVTTSNSVDISRLNHGNWNSHGKFYVSPVHDTYPFISTSNEGSMVGKSILITGASRGIGLATAIHLAKAGCSMIALAGRSSLAEAESAVKKAAAEAKTSPTILVLNLDVTSISSVQAAAEEINRAFKGRLDVLINNAGYLSEFQDIADSDPIEYWKTWNTNVNGTYLCTRYFLPMLLDSELKTIINITSAGSQVIFPGASSYQTTKFAICRFTEFLDAEYAKRGLITYALHPGGVKTDLALSMPQWMYGNLIDPPELPADTIVWLCKERRGWLSGRFVCANWNMEELEGRKDEIVKSDLLKFRMAY
ncbi:NAD(P)-binding protein [Hypoxylon sp. FL1857]|nr:NAD(P)-binding protein [Hypoxylon sp. FL1857]